MLFAVFHKGDTAFLSHVLVIHLVTSVWTHGQLFYLCDPMDCSPPDYSVCSWDSPGKNTGLGCHSLFQGIFPTQGPNPGLPHCRQALPSELPGKPLVIIQCYFILCLDCSSFQLALVPLRHSHGCLFLKTSFWSTLFVSSRTKCSTLILYISYHSLKTRHFSKKHWFL